MKARSPTPLVTHGTTSTYRNYACRCGDCTEAQRVAMEAYYRDHPEARERQAESMRRLRAQA